MVWRKKKGRNILHSIYPSMKQERMAESFVITIYIFKITGEKWRGIRVEYKTVCKRLLAFFPLVDKNGIRIFTRTCNSGKEFDFCCRYEKEIEKGTATGSKYRGFLGGEASGVAGTGQG